LLLQRSFQPPLADAFTQRLQLRVSRVRQDVVVPFQLLLAGGCARPLQLQLKASPLLLSAVALVQALQFSQIPVCQLLPVGGCALLLQLQLLVVQLLLSAVAPVLLLRFSQIPVCQLLPASGCARPLQLLVVQLQLNVPPLFRLQSYQLLPAVECVQLLQLRPQASLVLLSAVALVLLLLFSQIPVCQLLLAGGCARPLQLQLKASPLPLSAIALVQVLLFSQTPVFLLLPAVECVQPLQLQPLVVQLQLSGTIRLRTTSARTPESSVVAPFLRLLPPFGRLQPTCIVLVHKRRVHFLFFAVQLSSARIDVAAIERLQRRLFQLRFLLTRLTYDAQHDVPLLKQFS